MKRIRLRLANWQNKRRIANMTRQVAEHASASSAGTASPLPKGEGSGVRERPVLMFNASARLTGLSLNASFSLLTGWALRLAGAQVVHFVCQSGLRPCVLGINRADYTALPPCQGCLAQSRRLYAGADVSWFPYQEDQALVAALQGLTVDQLSAFEYEWPSPLSLPGREARGGVSNTPIPLGHLVLPSARWALRRHHLLDDESSRYLLRQYLLSAYSLGKAFAALIERTQPAAAVIFNGSMYPEATARWIALQYGLPTYTHEVGFQRLSTFFTDGEATSYPIHVPEDFELTAEQNARLDAYLEQRFQGQFTMAGIRFWPEMRSLDSAFLQRAAQFRQVVPVFTNVVYDTSQAHANVIFPHMFAWLDLILETIRVHPETLFVLRAHPDEMRPDSAKQSNESVRDWVARHKVAQLPNVVFIDSQEYVSSYELVQRSKFVIVYNSSIGLEAALMGKAVLCGGRARYTQVPTVFFPQTPEALRDQLEEFLNIEQVPVPTQFQRNARRFLYHQIYRTSLPLDDFLEVGPRQGFVQLKSFPWQALLPQNSPTMRIITEGILQAKPFLS